MVLSNILKNSVEKFTHKTALEMRMGYRTLSMSYKQVYEFSKKVALLLEENGVKKGDKVLLFAPNSPYWICVFWGSILRGSVIVPLNIQSTKEIIARVASQTEAKIIFKSQTLKQSIPKGLKIFEIEFLKEDLTEINSSDFRVPKIRRDDLVQILYTSGTTGDPKGVLLTHSNIYSNVEAIIQLIPVSENDKMLSLLPLSHIFEQVAGFLTPFSTGSKIIYPYSTSAISSLIKQHCITKMVVVPEFLKLFMDRIESSARESGREKLFTTLMNLSNKIRINSIQRLLFRSVHKGIGGKLRIIVSGGAPLDTELERKWNTLGVNLLQGYGLTETSPVISTNTLKNRRPVSVGKVIPGVKVKIASDGEILVKGPNVFKGYFKNKEKTKEAFTPDKWFKTDDIGEFDKDGFLYVKGRKKYLILGPAGQNVYPEDIEFELNARPEVSDSCVLGLEKPEGRIEIHAVLLLNKKIRVKDPELIINQVNKRLTSYQQVNTWSVWPEEDFPRSATRKVKKGEVTKYLLARDSKRIVPQKKEDKTPLIQLLAEITGHNASSINNSTKIVRELNLDSLIRVELVARIEEKFNVVIEETAIAPTTTVLQLEKLIKTAKPLKKVQLYRNWPLSWWACLMRRIFQTLFAFPIMRIFVKMKVEGQDIFEKLETPAIFMPNHITYLDAVALSMAIPPKIRKNLAFAAAGDLFYKQYKRTLTTYLGELFVNIFPFPRREYQNIKFGLDYMGRLLDKKASIAIYPEGKMSVTGQLQPLQRGTGLVAVEMDCPIVPVKVTGLNEILPLKTYFPRKRGVVTIRFGKPIRFRRKDDYMFAMQEVEKAMKRL